VPRTTANKREMSITVDRKIAARDTTMTKSLYENGSNGSLCCASHGSQSSAVSTRATKGRLLTLPAEPLVYLAAITPVFPGDRSPSNPSSSGARSWCAPPGGGRRPIVFKKR
jgi:hypothetical protein